MITNLTKYADFEGAEQFLTEKGRQQLKDAAVHEFGDPWQLTVGDFVGLCEGDFSRLGDMAEPTVLQVYWCNVFRDFCDELEKVLTALKIPQDAQEVTAAESMRKVSMAEGMVVFARSYFGLRSFADAERVTMLDYVIAKRDAYNNAIFSRRLAELRAKKYRKR